jgi:alkanesulfonate monooxygenase SsuD/methylene tetrahydromethanopterin reductase-like flavin-dependent oxidoreductase (luciferase family)
MLRLVAKFANIWNNMGIYHREITAKLECLRTHCERVGRDIATIEISQQTLAAIGQSPDEARRNTEALHGETGFLTNAPELCLTGTPDEIIARVKTNIDLGITTFLMTFGRRAQAEQLRRFARDVIPAFR